jgi:hypothetical protein
MQPAKNSFDVRTLLAAAAREDTGNGDAVKLPGFVNALAFTLDVTAAASTAADRLDVYVQTKVDGVNWIDVAHFTQIVGNGGAKRFTAKLIANAAVTEFEAAAALAAAAKRDLLGDEWRVRWVVTDDSTNAAFTFSVSACPM